MRRLLVVLAILATTLVWAPTVASAKGAIDAVVRGPHVLSTGVAKLDQRASATLALSTSLYQGLSDPASGRSRVDTRSPSGELGLRYVVTYNLMAGQDETVPIRQRLYPFAADGPIAYLPPGQPLETKIRKLGATGAARPCADCRVTVGGWFDVRYGALDVLADVGVPIPTALDSSTWATTRDDRTGFSIAYPPSWRAAPSTLNPVLADPITPLAVGTAAMVPQQMGECDIVPQHAVEAVGRTDALVVIYAYQGMASWSSTLGRPVPFGPEWPWRIGNVQCTDGNTDATVRTLAFRDGVHRITAMVVVGNDASPQRMAEVYAVLDSLRVP